MLWCEPDRSDNWSRRLGRERSAPGRAFPIRSLQESGAVVALGSDWPVARFDPRLGLSAARLRRPPGELERRPYDDEAIDGLAALAGYTTSAAATIGDDARLGRIRAGFDGVVAKRLGLPYLAGSREGVVKVKPHRTADCVVAGIRWKKGGRETIATLLLGLYDDEGGLNYVGSAAVGAKNQAEIAEKVLPLVDEKSDRRFSEPNRWGTGELEETPLKPKLVVEVRFDKLEKHRFRHGTRLLRFRPDKDPKDCTWREVRPPRSADDLAVEDLLR